MDGPGASTVNTPPSLPRITWRVTRVARIASRPTASGPRSSALIMSAVSPAMPRAARPAAVNGSSAGSASIAALTGSVSRVIQ
jgi:hypothetical protein